MTTRSPSTHDTNFRSPDSNVVPLAGTAPSPPPAQNVDPIKAAAEAILNASQMALGLTDPQQSNTVSMGPDELISKYDIGGVKLNLPLLGTILSYRRAHGSAGEAAFIREILIPTLDRLDVTWSRIGPALLANPTVADMMLQNIAVIIPTQGAGGVSDTLFSCHTDTVHQSFDQRIRQRLFVDTNFDHIFLANEEKNHGVCLGADDGAGLWVMLEMIRFGVPGTYVFHRGEERGCIGSKWIAENRKEWARTYKRAIAFDRKDTFEVITTQRGTATCSDVFAIELAEQLSKSPGLGLMYKPSPNGVYTDTASYDCLIPECTNVGVGYCDAHGSSESLDLDHVQKLVIACVGVNWDSLPVIRKPRVPYVGQGTTYMGGRQYGGNGGWQGRFPHNGFNGFGGLGDDDDDTGYTVQSQRPATSPAPSPAAVTQQNAGANKRGKRGKRGKGQDDNTAPVGRAVPRVFSRASAYETLNEDFDGITFTELMEYCEGLNSDEAASIISSLLEEIEALKARAAFARMHAGLL